jgi:hypothetical protein
MIRRIEVSTDVFAAIWASRRPGESTEDEILTRILGVSKKVIASPTSSKRRDKARWVDDIAEAFLSIGGGGYYAEIYDAVRTIRAANKRSIPNSFEEVIRKEIETHSSDSDAFLGREDLFAAPKGKGHGYWRLRTS